MLGSIYAMVAVALTLSIGVLRFLNFSIPGLFMIGGMTAWASLRSGMSWPLAIGLRLPQGHLPRWWSSGSPGAGCAVPSISCR